MKRFGLVGFALIGISGWGFSLQESWSRFGFEFGNYIDMAGGESAYTGAAGFNLGIYTFTDNQNIGFFLHLGFLFPVAGADDWEIHREQDPALSPLPGVGRKNLEEGFIYDFIIGPGFRYSFSDTFKFYGGAGLDCFMRYSSYKKYEVAYQKTSLYLGIGADLGLKFDLSDVFFINTGVTLSCFFLGYEDRSTSSKIIDKTYISTELSNGKVRDFVSFGIKPYLCIGINTYVERSKAGKPPRN
ncbi:MAG: hypothetical protein LBG90_00605 [Spirochaetaceae bacterium]|jgi:hypothetical protein|nr:hypothetical protein [Spirochaetaceae bacterium]